MSSWWNRRRHRRFLSFLRTLALALPLGVAAPTVRAQPETGERVIPVEVTINGGPGGIWPIVSRDGVLYAPIEAFGTWRLLVRPDTPVIDYRGFRYQPLGAVTGLESRLDDNKGLLELRVAADAFTATRLSRELSQVLPRSPVVPAAYANYDVNFSHVGGPVPTRGLGLLGEVGVSGRWGVLSQTFVARNLVEGADRGLTRLETSFRRDFPDEGYTLVAGDSVLRTGLLGRNAYFGGLQFGTNFELAPYINRQPVPLIAGETSAPSTVQLYVNDVLRQVSKVPAGPFSIDNLPALSGAGDVTVRVRDILGRETLITQPFLVSGELLAPALSDWSVEAGKLRLDLGTEDFRYGDGFVSGMWRRGLTVSTTAEGRLELSASRKAAGLAALRTVGSSWLLRGGAMASDAARLGRGLRSFVGVERVDFTSSVGASVEVNTRQFRSLGEEDDALPLRLQAAAQASWDLKWGRLGFAFAHQRPFDSENVTTYSVNYGTSLRDNWHLNLYFTRAFGLVDGYTVGAYVNIPIDRNTNTSSRLQRQNGRTEIYSTATHVPAGGYGLAWRALAGYQDDARAEAGVTYLSRRGVFSADISAAGSETAYRLGAVGGAIWAQRRIFLVPRFDSSAVLVSVPGQAGVGLGLGGQATQRTDAEGVTLLNGLQSYQKNAVRLDPNDLPISAEIESIEQEIVPPWRSVAKAEFVVRGGFAALMTIVFDDGQPAPVGSTVNIEGETRQFTVARRGEAYVTGLKASNRLQLQWRGRSCHLDLQLPPGSPEIARVGPLRCAGVAR